MFAPFLADPISRKQPLYADFTSIIIVNYNYGRFLGAAIKSALAQTYKNFEIIVADDGSTDDSLNIAANYPVKIVALKHGGVARAVDSGIKASNGKYYVLLSSDDLLHPGYVEKTTACLDASPHTAFVYTQAVLFGTESGILKYRTYDIPALLRGNYIPGTALTRRIAYDKVGSYDPSLICLEDWDHWLSMAESHFFGKLLPEPLFFWRRHPGASRNVQPHEIIRKTTRKIMLRHWKLIVKYFPFVMFFSCKRQLAATRNAAYSLLGIKRNDKRQLPSPDEKLLETLEMLLKM